MVDAGDALEHVGGTPPAEMPGDGPNTSKAYVHTRSREPTPARLKQEDQGVVATEDRQVMLWNTTAVVGYFKYQRSRLLKLSHLGEIEPAASPSISATPISYTCSSEIE